MHGMQQTGMSDSMRTFLSTFCDGAKARHTLRRVTYRRPQARRPTGCSASGSKLQASKSVHPSVSRIPRQPPRRRILEHGRGCHAKVVVEMLIVCLTGQTPSGRRRSMMPASRLSPSVVRRRVREDLLSWSTGLESRRKHVNRTRMPPSLFSFPRLSTPSGQCSKAGSPSGGPLAGKSLPRASGQ